MNDVEFAHKLMNNSTPQDAKYYGNQVKVNDYWHSIKQGVMYEILQVKVNQCTEFAQRLRDSQEWDGWAHKPGLTHLSLVCSPGPSLVLCVHCQ